jgi:osmoprotectant transport system ATP-binding protein
MIEFQSITKRYQGHTALDSLDLQCRSGETTVIIGPSGCGKSTLLRLTIGLVAPDQGQVLIEGRALGRENVQAVRHRTGYLVQEGGLFPHLSVTANLTLLVRHLRWSKSRIAARLEALSELARVSPELLDRYPAELSGGQRQRVGLMRALMPDPDLLLLDEPLGALDPMIRSQLQEELREIFGSLGKTVMLVTHDIAEAAFFADRIVLLRDGRLVQAGSLTELVAEPAHRFVTEFISAQRRPLEALLAATQ